MCAAVPISYLEQGLDPEGEIFVSSVLAGEPLEERVERAVAPLDALAGLVRLALLLALHAGGDGDEALEEDGDGDLEDDPVDEDDEGDDVGGHGAMDGAIGLDHRDVLDPGHAARDLEERDEGPVEHPELFPVLLPEHDDPHDRVCKQRQHPDTLAIAGEQVQGNGMLLRDAGLLM